MFDFLAHGALGVLTAARFASAMRPRGAAQAGHDEGVARLQGLEVQLHENSFAVGVETKVVEPMQTARAAGATRAVEGFWSLARFALAALQLTGTPGGAPSFIATFTITPSALATAAAGRPAGRAMKAV